jgi:pheromone shutdown protein TraB
MFLKHNYWYSVLFFLILNLSRNLNLNLNLFCCWLLVAGSLGSAACLARNG